MARRSLPLSRVYGLLEPGPVVLISVAGREGANIMTQSWHILRTSISMCHLMTSKRHSNIEK